MGLKEVHDKLAWTSHHFDLLDEAVTAHINTKNIRFIPKRYNETKTEVWGNFEALSGPPTEISHIFGDVIQSANSCLDYLICELFRQYNPGESPKPSHKFPLAHSHGGFNKEIGADALFGIPFEAVAVIESLQPYEGRTDPVPTNLMTLRRLTNEHKHRKIHVSVLTASPAPSDLTPIEVNGELFVLAKDILKPRHFETPIGPFSISENGNVNVDNKFAAVVVLKESGFREEHISVLAERMCISVTEAVNRFVEFF